MQPARARFYQGEKGNEPIIDYNEIREHDSHEAKCAKLEYWTAKKIGERLIAAYPNRQWGVNADLRNEMLVISCPSLSSLKGYYLPLRGDTMNLLQARAVKAAGEILERYGITRGKFIDAQILEALPRGVRDEVIAKDTKPEPMK